MIVLARLPASRVVDNRGATPLPSLATPLSHEPVTAGLELGGRSPRELAFEFAPSRIVALDMRCVVSMLVAIPRAGLRGSDHAGAGWVPNSGHHAGGHCWFAPPHRRAAARSLAQECSMPGVRFMQCCASRVRGLGEPD